MRKLVMAGMVAGTLTLGAAPGPRAETADRESLAARAAAELSHDQGLRDVRVVPAGRGTVRLEGTVSTDAERARAGRLARVPGVTRVDNDVAVERSGVAVDRNRPAGRDRAVDVGAETEQAFRKGAHEVGEGWISAKVKAQLVSEDKLDGSDIRVTTENDVVTLQGTVSSEAARARALEIARTTEGVSRVEDRMAVGRKR